MSDEIKVGMDDVRGKVWGIDLRTGAYASIDRTPNYDRSQVDRDVRWEDRARIEKALREVHAAHESPARWPLPALLRAENILAACFAAGWRRKVIHGRPLVLVRDEVEKLFTPDPDEQIDRTAAMALCELYGVNADDLLS